MVNTFLLIGKTKVSNVVHNSYVQAVIDQATIDGATIPNAETLTCLDGFFNDSRIAVPLGEGKLEMIKIGFLNDNNCLQFSRYNYVNPSLYKSVFYNGDPIYSLRGWSSDGDSYIDDVITMKRRPNLHLDSSFIVVTDAYGNASADQAACGSVSGNYYIIRPYYTGASSYYLSGLNHIGVIASVQNAFTGVSTSGSGGTVTRWLQNSTYKNGAALTSEMTNDLPVFTCAYNNAGTAIRFYTIGNIQFRVEAFELTDAEMEGIEGAWNDYVAAISPTFVAGEDITSDGREVWLVGGDSKTGTSTAVGRYAGPNSVFQRRRSTGLIEEVKGADLYDIPSIGSFCPLFGRLYNQREETKGRRVVFGHYGWGGSAFLNDTKSSSWDITDSGQLYPLAKVVWDATLVVTGVTKPKGIIIVLGINDMNETENITNTQTQMDNFFNSLNADYDSCPIYISLPSLQTLPGEPKLTRLNTIRTKLQSIASLNSNITIFEDEATDIFDVPANTTDGTHFNFTGNEAVANNLIASL